jgi:hypothetical protein
MTGGGLWEIIAPNHKPVKFGDRNQYRRPYVVAKPWMYTDPRGEEREANARLIAAAPEIYEAAKQVMDMLKKHGPSIVPHLLDSDENAGQRLRDALKKAEGEL